MGGGKGGGGDAQVVGYSYYLDIAYAFCDRIDSLLGFYLQENKMWSGNITTNGTSFTSWTGQKADLGNSSAHTSTIYFYSGTQTSANSYLTSKTGKELSYRNVAYLVFPQAFIGDNVRNVPTYGVLVNRINIDSASSLISYNTHKNIVGTKTITSSITSQTSTTNTSLGWLATLTGILTSLETTVSDTEATINISGANPSYIIYDILVTLLKIPKTSIDSSTFESAASVLYAEKLGLNIILHSSKKGIDWIEEILRYINGFVFLNQNTGKYSLKLLRQDYVLDDLMEITEDNSSDVEFTRPSRADLPNTFTIKYANITGNETPKKDSVTLTNQANFIAAGITKNTEIDLTCINTDEALSYLASFYFKKLSYPFASIKFKVSTYDAQYLQLGDSFGYSHQTLTGGIAIVFRVVKISGDSVKDAYLTIEAIEDIFHVGDLIELPKDFTLTIPPIYTLTAAPPKIKIFECTPENSYTRAVFVATTHPINDGYVLRGALSYELDSVKVSTGLWKYGVVSIITNNTGETVDRGLEITVTDTYNTFYEIFGTESDLQRDVYTAYWGSEAISFKTCIEVSTGVYKFSNIIRGIQNKVTTHNVGEEFWIAPDSANQLTKLNITSLIPTIKAYVENQYNESPTISTNYTYQFSIETPYPVNGVRVIPKGGSADLQWTPCVRLMGANFRNCDTIVAGQDEGMVEGVFNIYKDNVLVYTYTPTSSSSTTYMTYNITQAGTWAVETQVSTYKSSKVSIVVSPTDVV